MAVILGYDTPLVLTADEYRLAATSPAPGSGTENSEPSSL